MNVNAPENVNADVHVGGVSPSPTATFEMHGSFRLRIPGTITLHLDMVGGSRLEFEKFGVFFAVASDASQGPSFIVDDSVREYRRAWQIVRG